MRFARVTSRISNGVKRFDVPGDEALVCTGVAKVLLIRCFGCTRERSRPAISCGGAIPPHQITGDSEHREGDSEKDPNNLGEDAAEITEVDRVRAEAFSKPSDQRGTL